MTNPAQRELWSFTKTLWSASAIAVAVTIFAGFVALSVPISI